MAAGRLLGMYTIRYISSRGSDRPVDEERLDAPSVEDAAKHARTRVRATHFKGAVKSPLHLEGFLIYDDHATHLLHREYPFA